MKFGSIIVDLNVGQGSQEDRVMTRVRILVQDSSFHGVKIKLNVQRHSICKNTIIINKNVIYMYNMYTYNSL